MKSTSELSSQNFVLSANILHPPYQPYSQKVGVTGEILKKRNSLLPFTFFELPISMKYKAAIEACRIPPEKRTIEEIQTLVKNTLNLPYFQEMNRKHINKSEKIHERICVVLRYEFKRKGEIVFNADERANKFFIILSGSVNILVPKTQANILKEKHESPKIKKNLLRIQRFKTIDSEEDLDESEEEPKSAQPEKISAKVRFDHIIHKYHDLLGGLGLYDIKSSDMENLFDEGVLKFNYYNTLKEGQTFGELGLLTGKLRSATVICKEDCHFGVMIEQDYKTIVSVIERKKIYDKFEFFKKYLIKDVPYEVLRKLSYSFEKIKFRRNQYVYKEGELCKNVYLIKKGEVQIVKMFTDHPNEHFKGVLKKLPFKAYIPKRKKILLSILTGEFFGEDELMETKISEKEEKYIRNHSAIVTSSKASIYVCPLIFFKKFLLDRHSFYSKFLDKYNVKRGIRQKQVEICHQQEDLINHVELDQSKNQTSLIQESKTFKKSLKDYRARLKTLENLKTNTMESTSNISDILSPAELNPQKILMSPIGFAKNEEKTYESDIFNKIKYLNRKDLNPYVMYNANEKTQLSIVDDNGKTEAIIRNKIQRKKTKSEIELSHRSIRMMSNDSDFCIKPLSNRHYHSRHLDKVDLALLNNITNDYGDLNLDFLENKKSDTNRDIIMKIESIYNKKLFFFPKITNFKI